MLSFKHLAELAGPGGLPEAVVAMETARSGVSPEQLREHMRLSLSVMREAVSEGIANTERSRTGLSGGDARKLLANRRSLLGSIGQKAAAYAIATAEVNANMGRIVAAPTAGSSGVLPGVLLAIAEDKRIDDEQLVSGLIVAGGIGLVISSRATLAGAEGGCQAECGSAAAMAAGAAVYLLGGSTAAVFNAVALALKNLTGLACDPVAGLVEVPCVKRNAGSATIALLAAELALSGVVSVIPPDEVVDAVREVGRLLPSALKETAEGGLANTRTARELEKSIFKQN